MTAPPVYALFDDGRLYRDPAVRGDGWFLTLGEPTELVLIGTAWRNDADALLSALGLEAFVTDGPDHGTRAFADGLGVRYDAASSFVVEILAPPPARLLPSEARPSPRPWGDHVLLHFGDLAAV